MERTSNEQQPIEAVLERLRDGDADDRVWTDFYLHYRRTVIAVLCLVGIRQLADREDLASEVFFRFLYYNPWRHDLRTLPNRRVIADYLKTIALNVVATSRRRAAREREQIAQYRHTVSGVVPPEEVPVDEMLKSLSPEESRFFIAFYEEGLSISQLAERWNLSYSTAGTRLHRIRKRLIRSSHGKK